MAVAARFVPCLAAASLLACSTAGRGADGEQTLAATPRKVVVTATYRERIMVPDGSELDVRILDVSKSDSAATTVAESKTKVSGGPPYRVSLEIAPEVFIDSSRYHARARITGPDSTVMFHTRPGVPVLTYGAADSIEVVMRMGDGS